MIRYILFIAPTKYKIKTATAVVLVSAGTALAACGGAAQPKRRLLRLPVKRASRHDVREARKMAVNRLTRHVIRTLIRENVKQSVDTVKFRRQLNPTFVSTNDTEEMRKTILITGASSGFGRETARLFHQQGWNVIATMRSPEKENELNKPDNILVTRLDVQDLGSITNAIEQGIKRFGKIDVLLNNAGYGLMGVFESATREQIRKQYEVNVFGLMDVTRAVLPQMRKQGSGTVINISSFGGQVSLPFGSLYNSSKFAVEGFSEALSHELHALGVTVKLIEPGSVATNFRSSLEMIKNEIPVYDPVMAAFFGRYAQITAHLAKATPQDVAQIIYKAATDNKEQLRYVAGADAQFYIDEKFQNSDPDFIKKMRSYFIN